MEMKPIIEFVAEHEITIIVIFLSILAISVINIINIFIINKQNTRIQLASVLLVISNLALGIISTLLFALCVLFLDTSKVLYDNFDVLVSGTIQKIVVAIDTLSIAGILILFYLKIRKNK